MRKVIHKYSILGTQTKIKLPVNAKIVSFNIVAGEIVLYAEVDASSSLREERTFLLFNTGRAVSGTYIGTVETDSGIVWHCYESVL